MRARTVRKAPDAKAPQSPKRPNALRMPRFAGKRPKTRAQTRRFGVLRPSAIAEARGRIDPAGGKRRGKKPNARKKKRYTAACSL